MFSLEKYHFNINQSNSIYINVCPNKYPNKIVLSIEYSSNQKCLVILFVKLEMVSIIDQFEN